jgi:DNA polymerase-3 subunit beta
VPTVKFRCERDVLADAVGSAGRAATNRTGTLPVLSGVRMEVAGDTLTVTGTDLELTIRLHVEVGGERDGAAVVPARLVGDIVKALPAGAVNVELVDDEMSISAGRSQFSVRPLSLDDYPEPGRAVRRCRDASGCDHGRRAASGRACGLDR